ncbi:acetate/propionate family kinase [Thermomonospora catenispora]|uniref:acetate/propionate family kinase n=1 Tax=Thermomonospora catenispora TaxID=2493090 RepID=UPI00111DFB7A|nr:acetate/propionate family kinase [Thermomonospora catenispora]TNY36848.1 acetate/propionate family kinase [Thermomonospora catenispora]
MRVLTVNPGSSSLKISVLEDDDSLVGHAELSTGPVRRESEVLAGALAGLPAPDAVGVRFVHGGAEYRGPVLIDDRVTERLHELADLAPLHQPLSLYALGEIRRELPDLPVVACFDTAFHAGMPDAAATFALPAAWRERFGLRRYGFHGLSHSYAVRRAGRLLGADPAALRTVVCHLGAGASLAAVAGGRSVDTTMGFTPMDGLVMATRPGSLDPGLLLWLLAQGISAAELQETLTRRSGLRALAGTGDMREIRRRAAEGDADARLALAVYLHRLRGCIAAMTAALGGMDALVFTGGVGEHDARLRREVAEGLAYLGVAVDERANGSARGDADVTAPGAAVRTLVVTSREDLEIAAGVRRVLGR